jgi:hypothetical protein
VGVTTDPAPTFFSSPPPPCPPTPFFKRHSPWALEKRRLHSGTTRPRPLTRRMAATTTARTTTPGSAAVSASGCTRGSAASCRCVRPVVQLPAFPAHCCVLMPVSVWRTRHLNEFRRTLQLCADVRRLRDASDRAAHLQDLRPGLCLYQAAHTAWDGVVQLDAAPPGVVIASHEQQHRRRRR